MNAYACKCNDNDFVIIAWNDMILILASHLFASEKQIDLKAKMSASFPLTID